MKNNMFAFLLILLFPLEAFASWGSLNNSDMFYADTEAELHDVICLEDHFIYTKDTHKLFFSYNCDPVDPTVDGTYMTLTPPTLPLAESDVTNLTTDLAAKASASRTVNGYNLGANIVLSADDFSDGTANKVFTAAMLTKLNGIATAATANSSDATLLNRANHTGAQAESTVTNLVTDLAGKAFSTHTHVISDVTGLQTALDNKVQGYSGGTLKTGAKVISKHATASSGTAVFYLTDSELVGGNALCPNQVWEDSIQVYVNNAAASYQWSEAVTNSNKTLTVTINKLTTANILSGILGQAVVNSEVVRLTVMCD